MEEVTQSEFPHGVAAVHRMPKSGTLKRALQAGMAEAVSSVDNLFRPNMPEATNPTADMTMSGWAALLRSLTGDRSK